jgi:hypothetical protein
VPFLKLVSLIQDAPISPDSSGQASGRADRLVELLAGHRKWTLVVEERRLGQPREVRTTLLQLERYLESLPPNGSRYGLLLAPFVSEESARLCAEAGIGYADLAGNAHLSFDQVFIETRVADNPFRERRETRSLFAPGAARVLRVLLQGPLRPWKVAELATSAQVSLGWVSAVRRQLLAQEWAAEHISRENLPTGSTRQAGGIRITKPHVLLAAWAKADDWEKRTRVREYSLLLSGSPLQLAGKLQDTLKTDPPVFTQWFAAWLRHPHTTPAVVTAYVKQFPDESLLEEKLLARRVSANGGLRLVLPKDEGVLNPAQTVRGFKLVSDVQIYLDLVRAGLRGEEQAAELQKWPDFAGGWV